MARYGVDMNGEPQPDNGSMIGTYLTQGQDCPQGQQPDGQGGCKDAQAQAGGGFNPGYQTGTQYPGQTPPWNPQAPGGPGDLAIYRPQVQPGQAGQPAAPGSVNPNGSMNNAVGGPGYAGAGVGAEGSASAKALDLAKQAQQKGLTGQAAIDWINSVAPGSAEFASAGSHWDPNKLVWYDKGAEGGKFQFAGDTGNWEYKTDPALGQGWLVNPLGGGAAAYGTGGPQGPGGGPGGPGGFGGYTPAPLSGAPGPFTPGTAPNINYGPYQYLQKQGQFNNPLQGQTSDLISSLLGSTSLNPAVVAQMKEGQKDSILAMANQMKQQATQSAAARGVAGGGNAAANLSNIDMASLGNLSGAYRNIDITKATQDQTDKLNAIAASQGWSKQMLDQYLGIGAQDLQYEQAQAGENNTQGRNQIQDFMALQGLGMNSQQQNFLQWLQQQQLLEQQREFGANNNFAISQWLAG